MGQLPLMPEVEDAVLDMSRGERRIVRVHYPLHFSEPFLRGRTRLIETTLIDCKPNQVQPNLEDEVRVVKSGRTIDKETLSTEQIDSLAEVVNG